jgi:TatD DNase family protein
VALLASPAAGHRLDHLGAHRRPALADQRVPGADQRRLRRRSDGDEGAPPPDGLTSRNRGLVRQPLPRDERIPGGTGGALAAAREAGVTGFVTVGTDAERSAAAIAVATAHDDVWATVGLHPHDAVNGVETIVPLLDADRVVAVGECGLDYHYDHSPREVQREAFAAQVALAHERGLPLVIHTREAWDDTFAVLAAEGVPGHTIFHCFTGGADEARRALDVGAFLSFSGIVTFPSADDIRAAAALCPTDRILVETDSPTSRLSPPGSAKQPAFVPFVGAGGRYGVNVSQIEHDHGGQRPGCVPVTQSSVLAAAGGTGLPRFDQHS